LPPLDPHIMASLPVASASPQKTGRWLASCRMTLDMASTA
jgi:hypothetical protein